MHAKVEFLDFFRFFTDFSDLSKLLLSISGLRFCVLSSNAASNSRNRVRPALATRTTTTEDPLLEQFIASAGGTSNTGGGGNLLNLILNGHLDDARQLIENGADVNSEDQHGTPYLIQRIPMCI